ncbi:MAG: hypothetical protein DMG57_21540 [Acidobacteria bacterium]|nr:MAG: hypothetical protein DMG57_21540 [Acidobacteriota bacterium]
MADTNNSATRAGESIFPVSELTVCRFADFRSKPGEFRVFLPYTSPRLTRAALAMIGGLTRNLSARVTLFAVHIVPFPLPLDCSDVTPGFLTRQLMGAAQEMGAPVNVELVLARDRDAGLKQIIPPGSLVVVAARKRWWPTAEKKLAQSLLKAGYSVALVHV